MSLFSRIFRRDGTEVEGAEGELKEGADLMGEPTAQDGASAKLGADGKPDGKVATASSSARDEPTEKVQTAKVPPARPANHVANAAPSLPDQGRANAAKVAQDKPVRAGEPPMLPATSPLLHPATPATGIASPATKQPSGPKPLPQPSAAEAVSRGSVAMPAPSVGLGLDKRAPGKRTSLTGTGDATRPVTSAAKTGGANAAAPALNPAAAAKPVANAPASAAALLNEPSTPAAQASANEPTKITREELEKLATKKLRFLVDFMLELRWGTATGK